MARPRKQLAADETWTRNVFKRMYGPTCSPEDCTVLAPHTTGKFWRDQLRKGRVKGAKVGALWFVNSDSLCDLLGID